MRSIGVSPGLMQGLFERLPETVRNALASRTPQSGGRTPPPVETDGAGDLASKLRTAIDSWEQAGQTVRQALTYQAPHAVKVKTPGAAASAVGAIKKSKIGGTLSTLVANRPVNEQMSSSRTSGARLGLDHSSLERVSMLTSDDEINTETSTVRESSTTLGLDNGSPERASTLVATAQINTARSTARMSTATLGLDVSTPERKSTIVSTAEVNTTASSYDKTRLTFQSGAAAANLTGTYSGGIHGALKIHTLATADLSVDDPAAAKFEIRDETNNVIFAFDGNLKAGESVDITGTGLSLTFDAGFMLADDASVAVNVSPTTPTDVNPNAVFNAADVNARPRFEVGQTVGAGSFKVNGTQVDVFANDTINTVLARIGSTVSGVTANYSGDRVTLTAAQNSDPQITLSDDTSGFLAAVKLAGATATTGVVRDDRQTFATSSKLGAVQSGTFEINGKSISVDRSVDTLESVIAKINTADAGVRVGYEAGRDRLYFSPTTPGAKVFIGNDTSGFLAATKIEAGARGTAAMLDSAFNASGSNEPLFDDGFHVTAGSFSINGTNIDVAANDTISGVLAKITSSAAGVTASIVDDRITLTSKSASDQDIAFGADTSGFLAAVKLTGASTERGTVRDQNKAFASSTKLGSVQTGSFSINGKSINVDRGSDTLSTVVDKINAAKTGVTAAYDVERDLVTLTPDTPGARLVLDKDTSGFLAATNIALGSSGTRANPYAAFNESPLLDTGRTVSAGSFKINGVDISVTDNDSISSVLRKITASNAGVTATLKGDRVQLAGKSVSEADIELGGDTSGFLAAMKLNTATTVRGHLRDTSKSISEIVGFGSVTAGSFRVNGVAISVAPESDTIDSILKRINHSSAGVTASYDRSADGIVLTPRVPGATLVLDQDTSGFLAAAKHEEGAWGTIANADAAFDGTLDMAPHFDAGKSVGAGSFTINGVRIDVKANDSIRSVLAKITESHAGAIATYDDVNQRVSLRAKTVGASNLVLGADTSGFLAATKLDQATFTLGKARGVGALDAVLSSALPTVKSGKLTVNGHEIMVDREADSARSVLARLDALTGVRASIDAKLRATIGGEAGGDDLDIADETGLFAALGLRTGRIESGDDIFSTVMEGGRDVLADPTEAAHVITSALLGLSDVLGGPMTGLDRVVTQTVSESAFETALRENPHAIDDWFSSGMRDALEQIVREVDEGQANGSLANCARAYAKTSSL